MFRSLRRIRGLRLFYLGIIILFIYLVLIRGNILFYVTGGLRDVVGAPGEGQGLTPQEAAEFRERLAELEMKTLFLSEENFRLRKALSLDEAAGRYGYPYLLAESVKAEIVYFDHGAVYRTAKLNCGASDGVMKNDPVVGAKGLVGRVVDVGEHFCDILLLTHQDCSFGAVIRGTRDEPRGTREIGLVTGEGNGVIMKHLGKQADARIGDLVLTSGDSGLTPPGILIGEVDEVEDREDELMLRVIIKPVTDFSQLDTVIVLKYGRSPR
jgi:rod shape-determining protein MreC